MENKFEKESRSAALGTVIIVIAMVIIFGAVFAWMYSMDLLFLPDFVENILGFSDRGKDGGDLGALSEIVKNGKSGDYSEFTFDASYENLRDAFLREPASEGIYICADIGYYKDGEASERRIRFWKNGDMFRSETYAIGDQDKLETLKIGDAEYLTVIDRQTSEFARIPRGNDILPEFEAGLPSVTSLISDVEAFPARYGDEENGYISDCSIKMVRNGDANVYLVNFTYSDIGISEEYYVSLEHGTIISCVTKKDGVPVYSYDVVRISEDPEVWDDDILYSAVEYLKPTN